MSFQRRLESRKKTLIPDRVQNDINCKRFCETLHLAVLYRLWLWRKGLAGTKWPKIISLALCILALAAVTVTPACTSAAPSTQPPEYTRIIPSGTLQPVFTASGTMTLAADLSTVKSGAAFRAEVMIDTASPLRGAQWSLRFDPAAMKCDSFEEGSFFKNWADANNGSTLIFPQPVINNQSGTVSDSGIAIMSKNSGGASGKGVAIIYHFTALSDNLKMPELLKARVADEKGNMSDISIK
jgi:hypothetical protein